MKNRKLNPLFMYRAVYTYGKTEFEAIQAARNDGVKIPIEWINSKYGVVLEKMGIPGMQRIAIIKLLQNSIDIKTEKLNNYIDKIKAIVLIQIKIVAKYEDIITILLSQFWGNEERNKKCQGHVYDYISKIEKIVQEGIPDSKAATGKEIETDLENVPR